MGTLKITHEFFPDAINHFGRRLKKKDKSKTYCKGCGSPLTDPVSIRRGYGRGCWASVPVKIILDIRADTDSEEVEK